MLDIHDGMHIKKSIYQVFIKSLSTVIRPFLTVYRDRPVT
jgi:hypothetical protein